MLLARAAAAFLNAFFHERTIGNAPILRPGIRDSLPDVVARTPGTDIPIPVARPRCIPLRPPIFPPRLNTLTPAIVSPASPPPRNRPADAQSGAVVGNAWHPGRTSAVMKPRSGESTSSAANA
jgi:hypothetical protein